MIFWQLFLSYLKIGFFGFGGGYAMLSLIQDQVVNVHGWITEGQFTDIVAISQMTPGPIGINSATFIGYDVLANTGASHFVSILGSLTATTAVVLPSFLIVLALCKAYSRFSSNRMFKGIMGGLRPAVVGLIGAAAVILITPENFPDWKSWILFAAAFIASYWKNLNPIIAIILGGIAGFLLY